MDGGYLLLLCDEEFLQLSPSPSPTPAQHKIDRYAPSGSPFLCSNATDDDWDHIIQDYLNSELNYAPENGYAQHLHSSSDLCTARFKSIKWIISACTRLNLATRTAFNAVNYLDRFLSMNCCTKWEGWMTELVCIACLSIASKLDEVSIPSLHDYQMVDLDHSFQPNTIKRMELMVLKALNWHLNCITAYSYVDFLTCYMDAALGHRITELLLCSLSDAKFLEYNASIIATSALRCSLRERHQLEWNASYHPILQRLITGVHMGGMDQCHRIMEQIASTHCVPGLASLEQHSDPSSPVTVLALQRTEIFEPKKH